jgi:hypothetical protein
VRDAGAMPSVPKQPCPSRRPRGVVHLPRGLSHPVEVQARSSCSTVRLDLRRPDCRPAPELVLKLDEARALLKTLQAACDRAYHWARENDHRHLQRAVDRVAAALPGDGRAEPGIRFYQRDHRRLASATQLDRSLPPCSVGRMSLCEAKFEGGPCDRPARTSGLCQSHYMQQRRGKAFTVLKGEHGKAEGKTVSVPALLVPVEDNEAIQAEAERRKLKPPDIYREAVDDYAAKLRKRAKRR